jgi:hypothetical protein
MYNTMFMYCIITYLVIYIFLYYITNTGNAGLRTLGIILLFLEKVHVFSVRIFGIYTYNILDRLPRPYFKLF